MKALRERLIERTRVSQGAFATCYRACDAVHNRIVFLKVLNFSLANDPEMRNRFEREAQAVARLKHPHLVRMLEFGEDADEGMYMLLEWVDGDTLGERFKRNNPFTVEELRELARQLLIALSALHALGVYHRDIKPENILLCRNGSYKITDFSLAALVDSPRLTHHQAVVGTPAYMAPEQAIGKALDARSDLFAVGVVLYEALTGSNPFAAADVIETLRRVRVVHPTFTGEVFESLPQDMIALMRSCLSKKMEERPDNADSALALLAGVASVSRKPTKFLSRTVMTSGAIILCGALGWLITRHDFRWTPNSANSQPRDIVSFKTSPMVLPLNQDTVAKIIHATPEIKRPIHDESEQPLERISEDHVSIATTTPAMHPMSPSTLNPDSTNVIFDVRPWAQIVAGHRVLGTTPFNSSIRLPVGMQKFIFQNPAYPAIEMSFNLREKPETLSVDLGMQVITLEFEINPWGNVFIGDEMHGPTPFNHPVYLLPGTHRLRITHPSLTPLVREFTGCAGDTLEIRANLDLNEISFATHRTSEANR